MNEIEKYFKDAASLYNKNKPHLEECLTLIRSCILRLNEHTYYRYFGNFRGLMPVKYNVFEFDSALSRPLRSDLFIDDIDQFDEMNVEFLKQLENASEIWTERNVRNATQVIYTSVMSFACVIDLWKRSSRKTPGTFFEIYIASLIPIFFPDAVLSKHITLATALNNTDISESEAGHSGKDEIPRVATDLVVGRKNYESKIVIPLKITTRERIVQPFAHQRILDSAFGSGVFSSFLTCVSETQLDHQTSSVKQVCVPGTVKLFQRHLGQLSGLYYCDVPQRYAARDMKECLPVKEIGEIFRDFYRFFD